MHVLVVGANGQIGRRFIHAMQHSQHTVRAMVRDADQSARLEAIGANEVVVADLEGDCRSALAGCDAVVFTAGSGAHTPPEKTEDIDRNGAISIIDQAVSAGVRRFLMVSAIKADTPEKGPDKMLHYFRAKGAADNHLRNSGLEYTIVRPGKLTNEDGTGHVDIAKSLNRDGEIPRADVAEVLVMTLDSPNTVGRHFELLSGETPIDKALLGI
ncbi:SDR family oxidoreductase [Salinisphaera sp. Q1T1-3]|uniref:SDR family oxidoreductase n=1 Tax=Salinisphaera sp. Q1T1-3 TaxID=2321229 RepID=UPI000E7312EA|nr:SDR family oxidoreductase [Salinisphaera sp. Q1T1-3]RJS93755.1 SDR family oxidoreductase [Salinisphaera sp. Q1T1-3]